MAGAIMDIVAATTICTVAAGGVVCLLMADSSLTLKLTGILTGDLLVDHAKLF
jgi:hypothetical protein